MSSLTKKRKKGDEHDEDSFEATKRLKLAPTEIRNIVWNLLTSATFPDKVNTTKTTRKILKLDPHMDDVQIQEVPCYDLHAQVPETGRHDLMEIQLAKNSPKQFAEYFSETTKHWNFTFLTPNSLLSFVDKVRAVLSIDPQLKFDPGCFELRIFDGDAFKGMGVWQKYPIIAHGYRQGALAHFRKWMDALREMLKVYKAPLLLHLMQPWRDYENLFGVTLFLRDTGAEFDIWIDGIHQSLPAVPGWTADRDRALTVAAIRGRRLAWQGKWTQDDVQVLVSYGCRGVRPLWGGKTE